MSSSNKQDVLVKEVVVKKSWVELVKEEEKGMLKEKLKESLNYLDSKNVSALCDSTVNTTDKVDTFTVKEEPEIDESANHGESHVDRIIPKQEVLPNFGVCLESSPEKKIILKEPQEFLQEDLSLTGHLDGFKLFSPLKVDYCLKDMRNIVKTPDKEVAPCTPKTETKLAKRKLQETQGNSDLADELMNPSPSKIRKSTPLSLNKEFSRKRMRDTDLKKREVETDPEVILRRQKQVDYGKNTIGYDRYTQLVPREARLKMHPKTPPINLKFSRRAWDGLVKAWRHRLHFWDPPSEGGGNPECLELPSDFSDCSSTDGSLPSTPVQDWKRQRNLSSDVMEKSMNRSHKKINEPIEEDFDNQGCTPLPN